MKAPFLLNRPRAKDFSPLHAIDDRVRSGQAKALEQAAGQAAYVAG